jgi:hypothetical protein
MANATLTVSACDNEIYLIAYSRASNASYRLAQVQMVLNSSKPPVTINVKAGAYNNPTPISSTGAAADVSIPAGDYYLVAAGINWGVGWKAENNPYNFAVSVKSGDGTTYSASGSTSGQGSYSPAGIVWTPMGAGIPISVS